MEKLRRLYLFVKLITLKLLLTLRRFFQVLKFARQNKETPKRQISDSIAKNSKPSISNLFVAGLFSALMLIFVIVLIVPNLNFASQHIISEDIIYSDSPNIMFNLNEDGTYLVNVTPNSTAIKSIIFNDTQTNDFEVKVADLQPTNEFAQVYSIDPTKVEFSEATVTVQAKGNTLFKCKEWDPKSQNCKGRWKMLQKIMPGEDYSFTLTPEDPGYGESNESVIVLDAGDYLINSSQTILANNSGVYDIEIVPLEDIDDTINEIVIYDYVEGSSNILKIEDELNESGFSRTYAIDPTDINFTEANVTITALNATKLMKCANWNFTAQRCGNYCEEGDDDCETNETWTEIASISEGQEYNITLTANDPAFAEYSESEGESSTTSTSYQTKATETFTAPSAGDYLVIASAQLKGSATSYSAKARTTIDGTVESEIIFEPKSTSNYETYIMHNVVTLTAASHTINIDYSSSSTLATAYIKNARITLFKLEDYHSAETDAQQSLTTSYADYTTLTFTPAEAGNYLIIATGEYQNTDNSYSTYARLLIDGATNDEAYWEPKDVADYKPFAFHNVSYLSADSHTIKIQAREEGGTGNARRMRITAIKMTSDFEYNSIESNSESSTTSTSYQDKTTLTFTPATAGSYMFLATAEIGGNSSSYSPYATLEIDGTAYCEDIHMPDEVSSPRDYFTFACTKNITLDATSHTAKIRYRSSSTSGTAYIENARITAFRLLNTPPTTPTNITCDSGTCNSTFYSSVNLSCSGSTDADSNAITYAVEGYYNASDVLQTILFDAVSSQTGTGTLTFSHTIGNNNNRILIVGAVGEASAAGVAANTCRATSVTYNGTALTKINGYDYDDTGADNCASLWYMLNPSVGTANIVVIYAGTVTESNAGGTSIYNAKQQAPEAQTTNYCTSCTSISTSITTLTNGAWVVDSVVSGNLGGFTTTQSNTERWDIGGGASTGQGAGSTKEIATAGATNMGWSQAANRLVHSVAAFAPATASGYSWNSLGTHTAGNSYAWNLTNISDQTNINLRCRAIDLNGSSTYSSYYSPLINMTKSAADVIIPVINSVSDTPDPVDMGQIINITANVTDNVNVSSSRVLINGTNYTMTNATAPIWYYSGFNTSAVSAGLYNYIVYANDTSNNNATPVTGNFTISTLVSVSVSSAPINFTNAAPGDLVNATASTGFPLVVQNTGNVNENITIAGLNLTGQTNPAYVINVDKVNWALANTFATNYNLSASEQVVIASLAMNANQNIYFRLYTPMNIMSQDYQGNVTLKAYQN